MELLVRILGGLEGLSVSEEQVNQPSAEDGDEQELSTADVVEANAANDKGSDTIVENVIDVPETSDGEETDQLDVTDMESEEELSPSEARVLDTGVTVHHRESNSRYVLKATLRSGAGNVTLAGISIEEFLSRGIIASMDDLLDEAVSTRLAEWDIDIDMGGLDWEQFIDPNIVAYSLAKAMNNIIGRI